MIAGSGYSSSPAKIATATMNVASTPNRGPSSARTARA
jgi:hypothetical protein